ncbi:Tat pathway signal sequence domain protein [Streptomyces sp. SID12501]|uniref:Tat pathway signal sequence domain protein n=1 Tax=Streptomyces sp. SID12501 TaxID=2706042 RepID=A0A6B3C7B4_9ACTN|nr:Tat pathway signal sequence domain protein [Streptomyces sp. SID12501]NEC92588.1 Tat pathway signal sequence domain protein [Streptomyces sp. SID12501]
MTLNTLDRRSALRAALGVAGATAAASLLGATPAEAHGRRHPSLPEVPGMVGDRWANEFWYEYDEMSYYTPSQEMKDAVGAIITPFGGFTKTYDAWVATRTSGRYPRSFLELIQPNKAAFEVLSREQIKVYDRFYGNDPQGLVLAFQEYGQGTLFDPRRPVGQKVHMMNYTPPSPTHAYHRWHPFLAGFALLGIERRYWTHINRLAGTAWELQSLAQPITDRPDNPHLPRHTVRHITAKWLCRDRQELDTAFDASPFPADLGK